MTRHNGCPRAVPLPGGPFAHSLLLTALAVVCLSVATAAAPSVASVDVDTDPVYEGDPTQQVTVTFDEAMDTAVAPTITFSNGSWTPGAAGVWNTATEWFRTYTVTDANQEVAGVTVDVTGAQNASGVPQNDYTPEAEFDIDTVKPSVTSVEVDTDPVCESDLTQQVTVTFDEAMDTSVAPSITFYDGSWTPGAVGVWGSDTEWTRVYTLSDTDLEVRGVVVDVQGTKDAAGNAQENYVPEEAGEFDIDTAGPSVLAVDADTDPVYEGDLTQQVTVTFDEAMDTAVAPTIAFSDGSWTPGAAGIWNTTTEWVRTYTVTDANQEVASVTVDVTGARDTAGNAQENYIPESEFDLDTVKPSVTSVAVDTDPVYEGDLTQQVTVTFDEAMDTAVAPTIAFSDGSWTPGAAGVWNTTTEWVRTYTVTDANQEVAGVTVDVTGTRDTAGNAQENYIPESEFDLDTVKPSVTSVAVNTDPVYESDLTQQVTVTFDEAMDTAVAPTITFSTGTWTPGAAGVWNTTTEWVRTYTVTDANQEVAGVTVDVTGTRDAARNIQENYTPEGEFDLDTRRPQATTTTDHTNVVAGSPIYEGSLVLTVTVTYNEAMNTSTEPTVTLENEGAHWGGQVSLGWTGSTVYRATFTHDGTEEPMPPTGPMTAFARVATASGATDLAGNVDVGDDSPTFQIDTRRPRATVTTDHTTIADGSPIYEDSLTLTVTVTYDEAMDPSTTPAVTLEDEGSHWGGQVSLGWTGSTVYRATFTHDGTEEPTPPAGALSAFARVSDASGATDLAGNSDVGDDSPSFEIDTRKPEMAPGVTAVQIDTDPVFEGDLTQQVTLTFDEAMRSDGTADPTISFNHGTWTTNGDGAWNSPADTVWAETFTLTDNDEEFYDRAVGSSVVTVDVSGTRDAAGNEQEPYAAEAEFDIDTLQPEIARFTSVPDSGCFIAGDTIDVTGLFSESVWGDLTLNLDSGGVVDVLGVTDSTTETRTYTIQEGENSCDLDVATAVVSAGGALVDWAGNYALWTGSETNLTLPTGENLADHSEIIVDTTIPIAVVDPNGDEERRGADSDIIEARLDAQGQYRLVLRQDTPAYIDVLANDIELPCLSQLSVYDFPVLPTWGTIPDDAPANPVRYAPYAGYLGPDQFTYRAIDACGNISEPATVYVEVTPKLVLRDVLVMACAGTATTIDIAATDLFLPPGAPEDTEFAFEVTQAPEHGVLTGDLTDVEAADPGISTLFMESATVRVTYTPAAGFLGRDRFGVRLTDPFGEPTTAVVDIDVQDCPWVSGQPLLVPRGMLVPVIVPTSFAAVYAAAWDTVILGSERGVSYPDAVAAAWSTALARHVVTVDTARLPLGDYRLVIPLGNGETVTLWFRVGERP